jgi:HK97 family phage portal protein
MNILQKTGQRIVNKLGYQKIEKKDTFVNDQLGLSIWPTGDKPVLFATEAVLYMIECAPVWTALHKIAKGIASIPPKVIDKKSGEFVDHPVLKLLDTPNADKVFSEFMEEMSHWYLGTGNVYIEGFGFIERPPQIIRVMPSATTTIITGMDGYAQTIITRLLGIANTYNRTEVIDYDRPRFRFYDINNPEFREMYHIRSFNPMVSSNMAYGLSPLNAVFYEMRQFIEGAKSNLSLLLRSSRLSGIFTSKMPLDDKRRTELQKQIDYAFSGSNNSGRNILLGNETTYQDVLHTMRDMDYVKMMTHTAETIYKALDIPLPLVNAENMTYDNYESSQYYLFKDAVIPLRQRFDRELTNFLMPRYNPQEDRFAITFNPKDIPQLEPERNAQLQIKKNTAIYTINELRKESEAEPLDGGQYVYGTMGAVPIATDDNDEYSIGDSAYANVVSTNNSESPQPSETQDEQLARGSDQSDAAEAAENQKAEQRATKEEFMRKLKLQVNKDGTPRFTENEINELANRHFGE